MSGTVFNIQRYCSNDGPGIRTCVFLKGCPLNCVWCHNGESKSREEELLYDARKCISCFGCISVCENGCHTEENGAHILRRENCINCGKCADICPAGALERVGKSMSADEVMKTVLADKEFYNKDGGMTLTGGEPMLQFDFAYALAKRARSENITVAMETCGYAETEKYIKIAPFVDFFLFDCKASAEDHLTLTGKDDALIMNNLDYLCKNGANVILRCPVVDGANLNDGFIDKLCNIAKKYPSLTAIQLMPYHNTGIGKTELIGGERQTAFKRPEESTLEDIKNKIEKSANIKVSY